MAAKKTESSSSDSSSEEEEEEAATTSKAPAKPIVFKPATTKKEEKESSSSGIVGRVKHSNWSRPVEFLCFDWLGCYAIETQFPLPFAVSCASMHRKDLSQASAI